MQHLRNDLELGACFRALELRCRTEVPSEIGTSVPTRACDSIGNSREKPKENIVCFVVVHLGFSQPISDSQPISESQ